MLNNFKVGQKILAIVMLVGDILTVLLAVSYFSFLELRRALNEVKNEGVPNAGLPHSPVILLFAMTPRE